MNDPRAGLATASATPFIDEAVAQSRRPPHAQRQSRAGYGAAVLSGCYTTFDVCGPGTPGSLDPSLCMVGQCRARRVLAARRVYLAARAARWWAGLGCSLKPPGQAGCCGTECIPLACRWLHSCCTPSIFRRCAPRWRNSWLRFLPCRAVMRKGWCAGTWRRRTRPLSRCGAQGEAMELMLGEAWNPDTGSRGQAVTYNFSSTCDGDRAHGKRQGRRESRYRTCSRACAIPRASTPTHPGKTRPSVPPPAAPWVMRWCRSIPTICKPTFIPISRMSVTICSRPCRAPDDPRFMLEVLALGDSSIAEAKDTENASHFANGARGLMSWLVRLRSSA